MRILMVASEVPPVRSGVAKAVQQIADGARCAGHEVTVRSYRDAHSWAHDQVRLSTLGFALRRSWLASFDLVHVHGPAPTVSDVFLFRRCVRSVPVPLVYTHHFTVWGDPAWLAPLYRAYDRLARSLARCADAVVTTTPSYRRHVEAVTGPNTVSVVPWGVDATPVRERRAPDGSALRVLVLGQMRRYKGHFVALDACRGVKRLTLTLAGQGDLCGQLLEAAASEANVEVVVGPSDVEVAALYATHDVVLLPSMNVVEAFGIVLLEGMTHGCVPVASNLLGVSDIAEASGRVFRAGDAYHLRKTLLELDADRDELRRLSELSIETAAAYSWANTVDRYLDLYGTVAQDRRDEPS